VPLRSGQCPQAAHLFLFFISGRAARLLRAGPSTFARGSPACGLFITFFMICHSASHTRGRRQRRRRLRGRAPSFGALPSVVTFITLFRVGSATPNNPRARGRDRGRALSFGALPEGGPFITFLCWVGGPFVFSRPGPGSRGRGRRHPYPEKVRNGPPAGRAQNEGTLPRYGLRARRLWVGTPTQKKCNKWSARGKSPERLDTAPHSETRAGVGGGTSTQKEMS
jgi:hypothetical protein